MSLETAESKTLGWANRGVNCFTSSIQPWVSAGNRGPEREGGVSWASSGPAANAEQGPASHWWPPLWAGQRGRSSGSK